jgi:hypothetical protein
MAPRTPSGGPRQLVNRSTLGFELKQGSYPLLALHMNLLIMIELQYNTCDKVETTSALKLKYPYSQYLPTH